MSPGPGPDFIDRVRVGSGFYLFLSPGPGLDFIKHVRPRPGLDSTNTLQGPYKVKTFKNLLLRNQEADDLETWYTASGTQVRPNLFKW